MALVGGRKHIGIWGVGLLWMLSCGAGARGAGPVVVECVDVAAVWSGHPVGFCLLTRAGVQYVAFYGRHRRLTVAQRRLDETTWVRRPLVATLGWDSHNSVTMALDKAGHLHVTGNMHVNPLVYFRTETAGDLRSLQRIAAMVGAQEDRCTYPRFMTNAQGDLVFSYRDGASGRGNQIYNVYDVATRRWRRLLDRPLLDGRGRMNAYPIGPSRGPDGLFHMCWVWRDTSDCSTNHDLCYARSPDLVHWQTAAGEPVELPMTLDTKAVVVDPVPPGGGIINGNTRIGFDARRRPIVSYHKFDAQGVTQLYNARFEEGRWQVRQTSDWDYRWSFQGGGSIHFEIRVSPVGTRADGQLFQSYRHDHQGSGRWLLDEATLKPIGLLEESPQWPAGLSKPESDFPGMQVKWSGDTGSSGEPGVRYVLRWETLGPNRDRPREVAPPPSTLRLYKLKSE